MAALAYLLLPVTGLLAFLTAAEARVRFHGLQAIALGLAWPLLLYGASAVSAVVTQIAFALGLLVWVGFVAATLAGRDPKLPGLAAMLAAAASYREGEPT